jgi:uncharacterized protein (DUF2267 family)
MRYDGLVEQVQQRGGFASREEAVRSIRATLSTLGECLYRTERRHLASQLPGEAKEFLHAYADPAVTRRQSTCFSLEEFYKRVGARADVTHARAIERAQVVIDVVAEALPAGEWEHIVQDMPNEYRTLLRESA